MLDVEFLMFDEDSGKLNDLGNNNSFIERR
jgi:hypothetical protein